MNTFIILFVIGLACLLCVVGMILTRRSKRSVDDMIGRSSIHPDMLEQLGILPSKGLDIDEFKVAGVRPITRIADDPEKSAGPLRHASPEVIKIEAAAIDQPQGMLNSSASMTTTTRHRLPRIAFVTTCKGRVQHIERTLPQNIADNADYPNAVFVVLDYNSPDHLLKHLTEKYPDLIANGRLVVYGHYEWSGPFRMAHAKNMAHRCGILEGADILVNMDADNYAAPGFATWIAEQLHAMPLSEFFLWCNAKSVIGRARQGLAGRTVVSKHVFLKVGGFDEKYTHWAPEDEDFKCRVRRLGYEGEIIPDRFLYVIPHKDGLRFKDYPEAKPDPVSEARALREIREGHNTVVNYGKIGVGKVIRNLIRTVHIHAVPTRVLGIGMHKTATTSLYRAFKVLDLDAAHFTSPGWAKRIWLEMKEFGRSVTMERHYSLSDLPLTILFEKLDKGYPGSKFILTIRDERKWLKDVQDHWGYDTNIWRASWDEDWFTHKLHTLLYGQKEFNAEIFLARYRLHNKQVIEYFKHRPHDLLVMDMDGGAGWKELCRFLDKPIPDVPYPFVESTRPESIDDFVKWL